MEDLVATCLEDLQFRFAECEEIGLRLTEIGGLLMLNCRFVLWSDGIERRLRYELGHAHEHHEELRRGVAAALSNFETYITGVVRRVRRN